jgi:hypothetical protein
MFRGLRSNKLYVPLITILGSVALFFAYSFFYVSWQRTYANERAFRLLAVVGDQLGKTLENLKNVLAAALVAAIDGRDPGQYLKVVAGYDDRIAAVRTKPMCPSWKQAGKREGELTLRLANNPRAFTVHALFQPTDQPCSVSADVKLTPDLRERFHSLTSDYFDDILIATSGGDVLFESNLTGLRITNLNQLVSSPTGSGPVKAGGPDAPAKPGRTFEDVSQYSNVQDVSLAGSAYKLYIQPAHLQISADGDDRHLLKTLVCGLWRADRQQSQIASIPYSTLIWGVLVALAVAGMLWPLLKVAFMSPAERLKRSHVLYLLSSALFTAAVLTVIVLNYAYTLRAGEESREQLDALARQIDANVQKELVRALAFLNALENREKSPRELFQQASSARWTGVRFLDNPFFHRVSRGSYPYFDNVFWADDQGRQLYKLTVKDEATPQTSVLRESYFQDVRGGRHLTTLSTLRMPQGPDISEETLHTPFRFEARYSPNTGEYFVVLAKPAHPTGFPPRFQPAVAQVLVTRFLSLIDTVVPAGYGFALVDHDGLVQFHSSEGRNQVEDFFKESREDATLKALVINGASDYMAADYNGRRQLMLVRPLKYLAEPALTLIVFQDTNYFTTVHVACMLGFALLAALFSLPFLMGQIAYIFRPGGYPLGRLWPCADDCATYLHIVGASLCLTAAFAIGFPRMELADILRSVVTIAAVAGFFAVIGCRGAAAGRCWLGKAVILLAILVVGWRSWALLVAVPYVVFFVPPVSSWLPRVAPCVRRVNLLYTVAVFSLLTVLVVLPCFGLFKIAYHSVNRLALETAQRDRLDLLTHRAEEIRQHFTAPDALFKQRVQEELDRYDTPVFWPTDVTAPPSGAPDITPLERRIAWLTTGWFRLNDFAAQLRETALTDADNKGLSWKHGQSGDDEVFELEGVFDRAAPGGPLRGVYPMWRLPLPAAFLMALLAALLFAWLSFMIRKIFLTGLAKVPQLENWTLGAETDRNLLIIGHPKSGKSARADQLAEKDSLDLARIVTRRNWALPDLNHPTVVVDNFEFDIDNPDSCLAKLKLLEELVYLRRKRVVLISAVDPLFYLAASSPEILAPRGSAPEPPAQILDRWATVLSGFVKLETEDLSKKDLRALCRVAGAERPALPGRAGPPDRSGMRSHRTVAPSRDPHVGNPLRRAGPLAGDYRRGVAGPRRRLLSRALVHLHQGGAPGPVPTGAGRVGQPQERAGHSTARTPEPGPPLARPAYRQRELPLLCERRPTAHRSRPLGGRGTAQLVECPAHGTGHSRPDGSGLAALHTAGPVSDGRRLPGVDGYRQHRRPEPVPQLHSRQAQRRRFLMIQVAQHSVRQSRFKKRPGLGSSLQRRTRPLD